MLDGNAFHSFELVICKVGLLSLEIVCLEQTCILALWYFENYSLMTAQAHSTTCQYRHGLLCK